MPDLHLQFKRTEQDASSPPRALTDDEAISMLESADIVAEKLVPWGSNYTFAVGLSTAEGEDFLGIYKPQAGEQPLWDFPDGTLYRREYASYRLTRWLGWNIVPPTVIREGSHGEGSLQLYVAPAEQEIDVQEFWGRRIPEIERIVMFDHVANNADRKIGHCLVDQRGHIWGIDHGLTFNMDMKLRTVLWQYCGEAISPEILSDLERFLCQGSEIQDELREILSGPEVSALRRRVRWIVESGRYPQLDPYENVPRGWW